MKRFLLMLYLGTISLGINAQSKDFNSVLQACRLAQSSMSGGEGSMDELKNAYETLVHAAWTPLILQEIDVRNEAPIKNHLVFTPKFLQELIRDRKVYRLAKQYAEHHVAEMRSGNVKLCTKCVKGGQSVTYAIRQVGQMNVAAVAEVNGLINLSVVVKDSNGNESQIYKVRSDEFKGAPIRELPTINLPNGISMAYITISNRSIENKSVAIIIE